VFAPSFKTQTYEKDFEANKGESGLFISLIKKPMKQNRLKKFIKEPLFLTRLN